MNNEELKDMISSAGVRQWQVARELGVNEFSLSRMLRAGNTVSEAMQKRIIEAIDDIRSRGGNHEQIKNN